MGWFSPKPSAKPTPRLTIEQLQELDKRISTFIELLSSFDNLGESERECLAIKAQRKVFDGLSGLLDT